MTRTDVQTGIVVVTLISSALSIAGGVLLLATHYRIKELVQNRVRKLLRYLTIADLLTATGYFVAGMRYAVLQTFDPSDEDENDFLCVAQSCITTFSSMASFFWTTIIAFHLFRLVVMRRNAEISVAYHIMAWALPGIITAISLATGLLGQGQLRTGTTDDSTTPLGSGPWCWIRTDDPEHLNINEKLAMFLTGKGWEIGAYIFSAAFYMLLIVFTWRQRLVNPKYSWNSLADDLRHEERFRLTWLVLYVLRIWGTIRFFIAIAGDPSSQAQQTDKVLLYFQSIGDSGQAFCNFLIFCVFDSRVVSRIRRCSLNQCCCCNRDDQTQPLVKFTV